MSEDITAPTTGEGATEPSEQPTRTRVSKKGRKTGLVVAVSMLLFVLVGAGAYYLYDQTQTQNAASAKIDEATTLIENADTVVLDVDEVVRAEVTPDIGEQAEELQGRVPDAIEDLDEAVELIDEALPELKEEGVEEAEALKEAAEARSAMLAMVDPILEANIKAAASLEPALGAWEMVLAAEKIADESVAEYNKLTDESVKRSLELTEEALKMYEDARSQFSVAATGFPEADFSAYQAYVDGKIELLGLSKQADEAFLAGEKEKANTLSDQYNVKDKELVEAAKQLPSTPGEVVATAYDELAGEATDAYFEARERATEADDALNAISG